TANPETLPARASCLRPRASSSCRRRLSLGPRDGPLVCLTPGHDSPGEGRDVTVTGLDRPPGGRMRRKSQPVVTVEDEFRVLVLRKLGGRVEFVPTGEHKCAGDHSHLFTIAYRVDIVDRYTRVFVRHQSRESGDVDTLDVVR